MGNLGIEGMFKNDEEFGFIEKEITLLIEKVIRFLSERL